jgi:hypothetical protein
MRVFEGVLAVAFSQAYVASRQEDLLFEAGPAAFYRGQRNGLLGAAERGVLFLTVGANGDGEVGLRVHVLEHEPTLDDSWEECVEASFSPATPFVSLFDWDRTVVCEIPLPEETYRVRYTARGMDARDAYTDVYGLWFWPSPASPDAVIRQTSERAAYWQAGRARENALMSEAPEN